ncbi:MAG: multiprotein-bridging factor 1 family protein [Paracoccaceae bacterium]
MFNHDDEQFRRDFGEYLKLLRESASPPISREALASEFNLSWKTIQRIENGTAVSKDNQTRFSELLTSVGGDQAIEGFSVWRQGKSSERGQQANTAKTPILDAPEAEVPEQGITIGVSDTEDSLKEVRGIRRWFSRQRRISLNPLFSLLFVVIICGVFYVAVKGKFSIFDVKLVWAAFLISYSMFSVALSIGFFIHASIQLPWAVRAGPVKTAYLFFSCAMYLVIPALVVLFFLRA